MQRENKWRDRKEELTNEYNIFIERVIVENPFEDTEELTDEHRTIIKASLNFWLSKLDTAIAEEKAKFKYEMDRLKCEGISVQVECDWYINYRDLENYLENLKK